MDYLIGEDDFLRRLPACLHARQHLELNTVVFASDVISTAYSRLEDISTCVVPEACDISRVVKSTAVADAWIIIDQLHVIRSILRSVNGEVGPRTKSWLEETEQATLLRNGMDHIAGNISNLVAKGRNAPPVLGAVAIQVIKEGGIVDCMMIAAGQRQVGSTMTGPSIDTWHLEPGLAVHLEAFGHRLNLSAATDSLRSLLAGISRAVEEDVLRQTSHLEEAELALHLQPAASEGVMMSRISFGRANP